MLALVRALVCDFYQYIHNFLQKTLNHALGDADNDSIIFGSMSFLWFTSRRAYFLVHSTESI